MPNASSIPTPYGQNILVLVDVNEDKTLDSGLYVPESLQETPTTGVVLACGDGVITPLPTGTRVLFGAFAGNKFEIKGQKYTVLLAEDIFLYGNV